MFILSYGPCYLPTQRHGRSLESLFCLLPQFPFLLSLSLFHWDIMSVGIGFQVDLEMNKEKRKGEIGLWKWDVAYDHREERERD